LESWKVGTVHRWTVSAVFARSLHEFGTVPRRQRW
jgi:hypothetical protein